MTQSANSMLDVLSQIISNQIYIGQSLQIVNPQIQVDFLKNNVSLLNTTQSLWDSQIKLPSFCDLIALSFTINCQSSVIIQRVTELLDNK